LASRSYSLLDFLPVQLVDTPQPILNASPAHTSTTDSNCFIYAYSSGTSFHVSSSDFQMEYAQDAGAHPSSASDLKPADPLFTDPLANDNENNSDSPTFFDDFCRGGVDLDNFDFTLHNLDDLKESISPPTSQAAMLPNPVSASATFALEETIMDPRYQQAILNPFPSLTRMLHSYLNVHYLLLDFTLFTHLLLL
jgi:hypothetical protein